MDGSAPSDKQGSPPILDDARFCRVCEMWLNGLEQWTQHCKGKNHRKATEGRGRSRRSTASTSQPNADIQRKQQTLVTEARIKLMEGGLPPPYLIGLDLWTSVSVQKCTEGKLNMPPEGLAAPYDSNLWPSPPSAYALIANGIAFWSSIMPSGNQDDGADAGNPTNREAERQLGWHEGGGAKEGACTSTPTHGDNGGKETVKEAKAA